MEAKVLGPDDDPPLTREVIYPVSIGEIFGKIWVCFECLQEQKPPVEGIDLEDEESLIRFEEAVGVEAVCVGCFKERWS
ncbi:hypothetical protein [Luteolibacter soli]|uniref:Uncharacterized protein n=1 Tax=Luteolibacter soli TaxID=3135280 RepID=A0ABU9AY65_9BACT